MQREIPMGQSNNVANNRFIAPDAPDPQTGARGWVKVISQLTWGGIIAVAFVWLLKNQIDQQNKALQHGDRAVDAIGALKDEMHGNNGLLREIRDDQREFMRRPHTAQDH
jgi:hypothetical protein